MKLGNHRTTGRVELGSRATGPDPAELRGLPTGSCGAIFNAPPLARDARTMTPCHLAKGHSGAHANAKGVSWGTRSDERRSTPSAPSTAPATRGRTHPVPGRTDADRKALMQRHMDQINDQRTGPRTTEAGTFAAYEPRGAVAEAKHAVRLASSLGNDWLPSQLSVIIDKLDQAARSLVQHAEGKGGTTHRTQAQLVNGLVLAARTALVPGVTSVPGQREAVEKLRRAVDDLLGPLAEQQRFAQMEAQALADTGPVRVRKAPAPAPAHPWFPGHRAS